MRAFLRNLPPKPTRIVLGNEAADLDSVVCSLVYAFHLGAAPVINTDRDGLRLRPDVLWALRESGVGTQDLVFVDAIRDMECVEVCLVDHNRLSQQQQHLEPCVVQVLDHHADEGFFPHLSAQNRVIRPVGSATSLIVERILQDTTWTESVLQDDTVAFLCLCAILIDTANLDPTKKRMDPLDTAMVRTLCANSSALQAWNRNELYTTLHDQRTDISSLTNMDLLCKDTKFSKAGPHLLAFCSIPASLDRFIEREPFPISTLSSFLSQHHCTSCILLFAYTSNGDFCRDLALFDFPTPLGASHLPSLQLRPHPCPPPLTAFRQLNVLASRKQVLPLLLAHLG